MHTVNLLLVLSLAWVCTSVAADTTLHPPQKQDVQAWFKLHSLEEVELNEDPAAVYLRSKELAYLAAATFPARSGDEQRQVLLIRPDLQEVREAGEAVRDNFVVLDIAEDGVNEVMALATHSEQGEFKGVRSIVQFDGWNAIVLHQAVFGDNLGVCGHGPDSPKCFENSVEWIFSDLDQDGVDDLIEKLVKSTGPSEDRLHVTQRKTQAYLFKNDTFIKAGKALTRKAGSIR